VRTCSDCRPPVIVTVCAQEGDGWVGLARLRAADLPFNVKLSGLRIGVGAVAEREENTYWRPDTPSLLALSKQPRPTYC
jgi:hypothetical protein